MEQLVSSFPVFYMATPLFLLLYRHGINTQRTTAGIRRRRIQSPHAHAVLVLRFFSRQMLVFICDFHNIDAAIFTIYSTANLFFRRCCLNASFVCLHLYTYRKLISLATPRFTTPSACCIANKTAQQKASPIYAASIRRRITACSPKIRRSRPSTRQHFKLHTLHSSTSSFIAYCARCIEITRHARYGAVIPRENAPGTSSCRSAGQSPPRRSKAPAHIITIRRSHLLLYRHF